MNTQNRCRHACRPCPTKFAGGERSRRPQGRPRLITALLIGALLWGGYQTAEAQKLINRGQIINTGTIAVRDSVLGLPASIGGSMRLTGENQLVPARTYQNLALTSPAVTTKWAEGNLFVSETLLIGPNVTFNVPADSAVTLGTTSGRLTEQGYIAGSISKSVDLQGGTPSSDFGGIGASISWAGTAPGATDIIRTSGTAITASGNASIQRYYDIAPINQSALTTLQLSYATDELQGQDPNALDVWRLPPGETRWRRQSSTLSGNTLTITGLQAYGRFTFADTSNPLDPVTTYEWQPVLMVSAGVDSLRGVVSQPLDSLFIVRVTDDFGQPVAGVNVAFAVTGKPSGATGESLAAALVPTDADGMASTRLTLGNLSGRYTVSATVPSEPSITPVTFVGYTGAQYLALQQVTGGGQTDTVRSILTVPFTARLIDVDSSAVVGESVRFAILSRPAGDSLATLSDTLVSTNAQGESIVGFALGSRAGTYVVRASVASADTLYQDFIVTAVPDRPSQFAYATVPALIDTVMQTMDIFDFYVRDQYGNTVPGVPVGFSIASAPVGATGQSLTDTVVISDSAGYASSLFTLGDRSGMYLVEVTSAAMPGVVESLNCTAAPASPSLLAYVSGSVQSATVVSAVDSPLVVHVSDAFGNGVPGVPVSFVFASVPSGAAGQALSQAIDSTDASGSSSVIATLGTKAGAYTVSATTASLPGDTVAFRFTAVAGPPAKLITSVPLAAVDTVQQTVDPFVYTVTDSLDNPVAGVTVDFAFQSVPAGASGHFFTNSSVTSDSLGQVSNTLRLGSVVGTYTIRVSSLAMPGVEALASVQAVPARASSLVRIAGSGQSNQILTLSDSLLVVGVKDSLSNPVAGVPIDFAITSAPASATGQSVTAVNDTTDASGLAETRLQLGTKVGVYVVTATSPSIPGGSVDFTVTATHGAAATLAASGVAVRDTVLKLASPLTVTLLDVEQNPIPNAIVRYGLETPPGANGQYLSADSSLTDSLGQTSVILHFGDKAGVYTVYAVADLLPGQVRQLSATALPAGLAQMVSYETPVAPREVYTFVDSSFVIRTADQYGNPVPGVPVKFSVVDTPANAVDFELSKYADTTNVAGLAWTNLILGSKVGVYTVSAEVAGMPDILFTITAKHGAPKSLAKGSSDTTAFQGMLAPPFFVTVLDTGANVVPDSPVTFSIVQAPQGATGYSLTSTIDTTDANGRATTALQLGNRGGRYTVSASVGNLAPVLYTVTAIDAKGNPNLDTRIDIADLTTIVDYVLGNLTLSGTQFAAADLDTNGVVDLRDALIVRDYILSRGAWVITDTVGLAAVEYPNIVIPDRPGSASGPDEHRSSAAGDGSASGSVLNTTAMLEFTKVGIRLNLSNDVPVKGLQLYVRFKRQVPAPSTDVKFSRAHMMNVFVAGSANEVVAAAFNFSNTPIDSGSGPVLRLPLAGMDTTDIDSVAIIVSTGSRNVSTQIGQGNVQTQVVAFPTTYTLYQNYPNPFNAQTTIEYEVPEITNRVARVFIQVFNMLGEKVVTIDRGEKDAGRYKVVWNGRDDYGNALATGVYFYRLISIDPANENHFTSTKKMIYLK